MKKLGFGLFVAIMGAYLVSCVSAPARVQIGETLDETLGIQVSELAGMLGKTQSEIEQIIGRRLRRDGENFKADNYPAAGILWTSFQFTEGRANLIDIFFLESPNVHTALLNQTNAMFGNSILIQGGNLDYHLWSYEDGMSIRLTPSSVTPNREGRAYFLWRIMTR